METEQIKKFTLKLNRNPESNKYDFGHVLVVAGSKTMPGAGVLCCVAAMRAGAGLVTYAVEESFLTAACAMSKPESMFFVYSGAGDIINFVKERKVKAIVLGPGLLVNGGHLLRFVKKIIRSVNIPVVLDASALTCLGGKTSMFKKAKAKLILTPHAGEFAKLTNTDVIPEGSRRDSVVQKFAKENSLILALKGHNTVVSDGDNTYVNDSGTPAMATAGSGDVLSGIIAAFACIDRDLFESVSFAVWVHGLAGEAAEEEKGETSVIASDIVENICKAVGGIR